MMGLWESVYSKQQILLGRIAFIAQMWPVATDVTRSVVCVSVCVGYTDVLCKNG